MDRFFRFFVERHILASLFTVMVILLGVGSLLQIRRDLFPEVDFGQVVITTRYPGASPEDVELNVTNEIESAISEVSGIEKYVSHSMENLSIVTVSINVSARNKDEIRDDLREAVSRVTDLPPEVTDAPLIREIESQEIPVLEVGLAGDVDYTTLREAARKLKRKLEQLPGVSRVDDAWNLDREVRIEVDPDSMEQYGVPLQQVATALRTRNVRAAGGSFDSYVSKKGLVTLAQFRDISEVESAVVVAPGENALIRIRDMADVIDTFQEPRLITRINGQPAIVFQVIKESKADIIRMVATVKQLAEKEKAFLEPGIEVVYSNDISYYLENRFNVVLTNGGIGLLLVVLILAVFMSTRAAFWVALSIPVILLGVVFLLPVAGAHLDVIGLAAMILVLGIIVDDGIIVSEAIVRKREEGLPAVEAAIEGIRSVAGPVFATLVTTFLAFAPMFFMTGVFGEFIISIPLVITLAVLVSVAEVVIALPAHLTPGLARMDPVAKPRRQWFNRVRDLFRKVIGMVLRLRYAFLGLSAVLFAGAILVAVLFMDFVLFPSTAANAFQVHVELPQGSSREHTARKVTEIEQIISELPSDQLASFTTRIGSHGERSPGEFENWAWIRADLTPFSQRGLTADEIVDDLREGVSGLSGFDGIIFSVEAGGPPVGSPVTIRVIGPDDDQRRALSDAVVHELDSIDGVRDIDRTDLLGKREVRLVLDYDKLSLLGLSVSEVASTVRIAYDGEVATTVRYGDEDVDFRVILAERARRDLSSLSRLHVRTKDGDLVRLGSVAEFTEGPGPASVYHFDGLRATTITADVDKKKISPLKATSRIQEAFDLDRDWPGTRFVIGGESQETAESFKSLGIAFAIAIVGIFFILVLLFNSWTQPFMVMIAIPFGIIAVIIAFAIHGQSPGFLAILGLVGLTGVVVNDSLVMVSHINDLRKQRPDDPITAIVADGATNRLRAIVMTTITTVVGLIPLAYGIGGSDPFIAPMALALGYGLLFATPLTLLMIPSLYVVREDIVRLARRILRR